ncbi:MAG: hypothetical protein ACRDYC_01950 [Acidimicrobiales bacterium]
MHVSLTPLVSVMVHSTKEHVSVMPLAPVTVHPDKLHEVEAPSLPLRVQPARVQLAVPLPLDPQLELEQPAIVGGDVAEGLAVVGGLATVVGALTETLLPLEAVEGLVLGEVEGVMAGVELELVWLCEVDRFCEPDGGVVAEGLEAAGFVDSGLVTPCLEGWWGARVVVVATTVAASLADWVGEGPWVANTEATATVGGITTAAHAATIPQRSRPPEPRRPPLPRRDPTWR